MNIDKVAKDLEGAFDTEEVSEEKTFSINDLVALLNEDLKLEYAAAIQYYNHAAMIKGSAYQYIANEIQTHGDEEIGHAKKLVDIINFYGGNPAVSIGETKVADDNDAMLVLDLESESIAIARYTQRIEQAEELCAFAVVKILQDIITDEQSHALEVTTALGM